MRGSLQALACVLVVAVGCTNNSTTVDPPVDPVTQDAGGGGTDAAVGDAAVVVRDAGSSSGDAATPGDSGAAGDGGALDGAAGDGGLGGDGGPLDAGDPDAGVDAGVDAGPVPMAQMVLDEDMERVQLRATLPGGGSVVLDFPPHAVREQVEVKVFALPAITLPVGTVVAGVRLEPDGLQLYGQTVMALELPGHLTPRTTVAFGVHGADVTYEAVKVHHTTNMGLPVSRMDVSIYGFSDHGVATAPPQAAAAAASVAVPLNKLRADLLGAEQESDPMAEATARSAILQDFWDMVVKPRLEDAALLPATLDGAMALYVEWRDQYVVMRSLNNAVVITADIQDIDTLTTTAIRNTLNHYNTQCVNSFDWLDAQKTVDAWLWAPVVYVDTVAGLTLADLRAQLCIQMDILQADLDAILDANSPRPLTVRAGTKITTRPTQFNPPTRLRVTGVQGGTVDANPTYTDAMGNAELTATLQGDASALTTVITASAQGLRGIVSDLIRVFRPKRGAEQEVLIGRTYSGLVDVSYDTRPFGCANNCGMDICPVTGDPTGVLVVAGDPFAYQVQLTITYDGNPTPTIWDFAGAGTPSAFSGRGVSVNGNTTVAPFWTLTFSVVPETGALTGLMGYSCQRYELGMTGMPVTP